MLAQYAHPIHLLLQNYRQTVGAIHLLVPILFYFLSPVNIAQYVIMCF